MIFTQYYLDCLSLASYLIGDETTGRAVVVDPRRDVEEYLADAAERGLTIEGVICTHFHADFVSGHLELAKETGAWIGFGDKAVTDFPMRPLHDGERISLGEVTLEVMTTPGHTPESVSIVVREHPDDEVPYGVLTGDALFIGDVGRPDLLASVGVTATELGAMLHDSVQRKLMSLPDEVRVFPAHGAGSACGKNLSTEKQSTIGEQRRTNYACRPMTEAEFIDIVTEGQPAAPAYFVYNATLNREERPVRAIRTTVPAITGDAVEAALERGAVVVDARPNQEFAAGHLDGAVNIPVDGRMAETIGMVLTPQDEVVIIAPDGLEQEAATRFTRIGFDHVLGYVPDPEDFLERNAARVRASSRLTVAEVDAAHERAEVQVVDVRNAGELAAGMLPGAKHIPLAELTRRADELDPDRPVLLYCAGGWRSCVASSVLRARGFQDVSDILGGHDAWSLIHATAS